MKMMTKSTAFGMTCVLAACGGSGSGSDAIQRPVTPPPGSNTIYLPVSDTSNATSALAGAILADSGRTATLTTGTLLHASQSFSATGVAGNRSLTTAGNFAAPTENYDFLDIVGLSGDADIVIGTVTSSSDMPLSGSARYAGRFDGVALIDGTIAPQQMNDWASEIAADFISTGGTLTATFAGDGVAAVDRIEISNIAISGSSFSGGDLSATRTVGGVPQAVTIFGEDADLVGSFFGADVSANIPDELGGVVSVSGESSEFFGIFIAE